MWLLNYQLVLLTVVCAHLRVLQAYSTTQRCVMPNISAKKMALSLASPTYVTDDCRRLGDRYIQSSGLSLTIVAVELMTSLHLHAPSPFLGSILPAYSAALFSTKVLSDAAGRNRLDATTFRLLNLGIILDAVQTVSSTLPITLAIARSSSYLKSLFGLLCLCHAYLTASTSYSALSSYGVPKIKFGIPGPLSAAYLFLAASNFFLPPQVYSCSFLVTAIFLALNGASVAGQKRLSSTTYKTLNCAVVANSLFKLYGLASLWPRKMSSKAMLHSFFVFFFPVFSLLTAVAGLFRAVTYKE